MMSTSTIIYLSRQAAVLAANTGKEPYEPANPQEPLAWRNRAPIPNLGQYRPKGWALVHTTMVDSTGRGYEWEPAMTIPYFCKWASTLCESLGEGVGFAVVESGECQVVVGVFLRQDSPAYNLHKERSGWQAMPDGLETVEDYPATECPECGAWVDAEESYCSVCGESFV